MKIQDQKPSIGFHPDDCSGFCVRFLDQPWRLEWTRRDEFDAAEIESAAAELAKRIDEVVLVESPIVWHWSQVRVAVPGGTLVLSRSGEGYECDASGWTGESILGNAI